MHRLKSSDVVKGRARYYRCLGGRLGHRHGQARLAVRAAARDLSTTSSMCQSEQREHEISREGECNEVGGLLQEVRQPGLQWRPHGQRLQIRGAGPCVHRGRVWGPTSVEVASAVMFGEGSRMVSVVGLGAEIAARSAMRVGVEVKLRFAVCSLILLRARAHA